MPVISAHPPHAQHKSLVISWEWHGTPLMAAKMVRLKKNTRMHVYLHTFNMYLYIYVCVCVHTYIYIYYILYRANPKPLLPPSNAAWLWESPTALAPRLSCRPPRALLKATFSAVCSKMGCASADLRSISSFS